MSGQEGQLQSLQRNGKPKGMMQLLLVHENCVYRGKEKAKKG